MKNINCYVNLKFSLVIPNSIHEIMFEFLNCINYNSCKLVFFKALMSDVSAFVS